MNSRGYNHDRALPGTARHNPRHTTDALGGGRDVTLHTADRIPTMCSSDGSPQQDDGFHRRSRSRSPVLPGGAREARAERSGGWQRPPLRSGRRPGSPTQAEGALPGRPQGAAAAAKESREDAKYRAHTEPSPTHLSPPKPYLLKGSREPKAAWPEGSPRCTRAPFPKRTPADIKLLQLQCRVVKAGPEGGGGHGGHRGGRGGDDNCAGRGARPGGTRARTEGKRGKVAGGRGGGGTCKGRAKARAAAGGGA